MYALQHAEEASGPSAFAIDLHQPAIKLIEEPPSGRTARPEMLNAS